MNLYLLFEKKNKNKTKKNTNKTPTKHQTNTKGRVAKLSSRMLRHHTF